MDEWSKAIYDINLEIYNYLNRLRVGPGKIRDFSLKKSVHNLCKCK